MGTSAMPGSLLDLPGPVGSPTYSSHGYLHKTRSISIPTRMGRKVMRPHFSLKSPMQLVAAGGGRKATVAMGKLRVLQ